MIGHGSNTVMQAIAWPLWHFYEIQRFIYSQPSADCNAQFLPLIAEFA
jgi:hypothetical protein